MFRQLFHSDVFFPEGLQDVIKRLQCNFKAYQLSKHFEEHLDNQDDEDRSHTYLKNAVINNLNELGKYRLYDAFEVELSKSFKEFGTHDWVVTKYCIRVSYSYSQDLVIVIRPGWNKSNCMYNPGINLIVTAWINHRDDSHKTLNTTKYCCESLWESINSFNCIIK